MPSNMTTREITLPAPLRLGPEPEGDAADTRPEFGVPELLAWAVNNEPAFNRDGPGIRAGARIEAALATWAATDPHPATLRIDAAAWKIASEVLETPTAGYPITPARRLLPFLDAIATAREV